jgi:nitronate monooxygenase
MFHTRITELLGIRYPIIQGGLLWISHAEFAAAVSNAGGLGVITALSFGSKKEIKEEIRRAKDLTDKPFAVNVSMFPQPVLGERTEECFEAILEEGVGVVETGGRNPEFHVPRLKEAGVTVIHKVAAIRHAQKAESAGVDAVTMVGYECAGHPGMDDVTTLILISKATKALKIPVIAGGGFYDGRGLLAALALGAEAILMGTRFFLTRECWAHPRIKESLLRATERDTMVIERSIRNAARVFRNRPAQTTLEMEERGATLEELLPVISGQMGKKAYEDGDPDGGIIACGQVVGLIDEVKSISEVIQEIVEGARDIYLRLGSKLGVAPP